ncbi:MAG: hypothetical protein IJW03_03285 [Clostridia bacterium]|nr:hypothetical protein [Clostridia bacterium]
MNCPKCDRPLPIGAARCSECGTEVGEANAFLGLKSKTMLVIREKISSPLFLVYTIFTTVIALLFALNGAMTIKGNLLVAVVFIAVAACTAISAISGWKMYLAHGNVSAKDIRTLNMYNVAMLMLSSIGCIFVGLLSFLVVIICALGGLFLGLFGGAESIINTAIEMLNLTEYVSSADILAVFKNGGVAIAAIGAIVAVLAMFAAINVVLLYKNNGLYIKRLSAVYESENYDIEKYPKVRPWAFCVIFVIAGIVLFAVNPIMAVTSILMGGMFIVSMLWYESIHNGGCDNSYISTTNEITTDVPYAAPEGEEKAEEQLDEQPKENTAQPYDPMADEAFKSQLETIIQTTVQTVVATEKALAEQKKPDETAEAVEAVEVAENTEAEAEVQTAEGESEDVTEEEKNEE